MAMVEQKILRKLSILGVFLVVLMGSATLQAGNIEDALRELSLAQSNYDAAVENTQIQRFASEDLILAKKLLDEANLLARRSASRGEIRHFAYLANQQIEIARETTALKVAELELDLATGEQARLSTEAEARRAELARLEAEQRAAEAELSAKLARERERSAEFNRLEAESRAERAEFERDAAEVKARATELRPRSGRVIEERYQYRPSEDGSYFERYEEVRETTTWR